ncbi:MAG: P-II family nitrogen regulator [Ruminococcaceae bacterium]|nr:P-II family nitrogen regulator [Oscillospiraceae bacterium]
MKFEHELILCIVNVGFSDAVMEAARACGAGGGTVINARGTANKEAETFFKITIQPEKEAVMILVPAAIKDSVLRALYEKVGLQTPGQGIALALPVDGVVGLPSKTPPTSEN